jgi:hypothetical protein
MQSSRKCEKADGKFYSQEARTEEDSSPVNSVCVRACVCGGQTFTHSFVFRVRRACLRLEIDASYTYRNTECFTQDGACSVNDFFARRLHFTVNKL